MRPSAFAKAKKLDVPQQLCYLPIAISAFDKNYTNAFGAYGTWGLQYLPSVKFGMLADSCYDERLDFELCSSASLKYLKFLHQTFGTWDYAITAYVCGPTNIRKAQVGSYSFAETFSKLTASEKYLFYRFLALLRWMEENETINFSQLIESENTTVDSVVVSSKMHFNQISEVLGIDLKTLQQLNPLFICNVIDGRNYPKTIYLPQNYGSVFIAKSDSIAVYKDSVYFPKYAVKAVTVNETEVYTSVSPGKDYDAINYVIKSGDNLGAIAEKYGVKVADLQDWNNISGTNIYAGKQITIYVKKGQTVKVIETVAPVKPKTSPNVFNGYEFYENYEVKSGDSPYSIAKKYSWASADDIMAWNNIDNPSKLRVGQKLKIFKKK
jgi:membrane-bound lytic murein transglycosylase D